MVYTLSLNNFNKNKNNLTNDLYMPVYSKKNKSRDLRSDIPINLNSKIYPNYNVGVIAYNDFFTEE